MAQRRAAHAADARAPSSALAPGARAATPTLTAAPVTPLPLRARCRPLHRFGRFFLGVMFIKALQKGQRGRE